MSNVEIRRGPLPGETIDTYHIPAAQTKKHYYGKLAFLAKQPPSDTITLVHEGASSWQMPKPSRNT